MRQTGTTSRVPAPSEIQKGWGVSAVKGAAKGSFFSPASKYKALRALHISASSRQICDPIFSSAKELYLQTNLLRQAIVEQDMHMVLSICSHLQDCPPSGAPSPGRRSAAPVPGRRGCPQHSFQPPNEFVAFLLEETLEPRRELGPVDRPLRELYPYASRPQAVVPVPVLPAVAHLPALSLGRAALSLVVVLMAVVTVLAVLLGVVTSLSIGEDVRELLVHLR